jgi:methyl-accepting chemotaxis protein
LRVRARQSIDQLTASWITESSENIDITVSSINRLQTNILAFNAAVEAAGGEQGEALP